jgi:2-polyprenyl-3-methyl-5-hydroxy-6-metoxy-1,4-benzoquinol methylase
MIAEFDFRLSINIFMQISISRQVESNELMLNREQCLELYKNSLREQTRLMVLNAMRFLINVKGRVIDLGCGPGDITATIKKHCTNVSSVTGIDGSPVMIELANQFTDIEFVCDLFDNLTGTYDTIISTLTLHHQDCPENFWRVIKQLSGDHTEVFVMDTIRPDSLEKINFIVETMSGQEPEIFKNDFRASLHASFTTDEIQDQLYQAGLNHLTLKILNHRQLSSFIVFGKISMI